MMAFSANILGKYLRVSAGRNFVHGTLPPDLFDARIACLTRPSPALYAAIA